MDSGRNFKITRAILVMTAILMSVVLGSIGVSHNQNPSTETSPETVAKLSKQSANIKGSQSDKQQEGISASLAVAQPRAEKLAAVDTTVHKSGALTQDETWTSEHTYITDEPVVVPEGKTLTITPGTVVKNTQATSGIVVETGGTLIVSGSAGNPVTFTSIKDDTVGGDTNTDGTSTGALGDFNTAIQIKAGSNVTVQHASVTYATTAFVVEGSAHISDTKVGTVGTAFRITNGEVKLTDITIDSVASGIAVTSGVVTFAGSMTNVTTKDIQACSWGTEGCSVDATYTNLGPEALVTVPACGQVTLASTLGGLIEGLLRPANCESTTLSDAINPAI